MSFAPLTFILLLLQQMPHPDHHADPGVWWTHWAWMLLWFVLAVVIILVVVRLLWPTKRS